MALVKSSNSIIVLHHSEDTLKIRFYLLALLSGLFLIVALPVGIVFLVFVALYYVVSNREESRIEPASADVHPPDPDFNSLFNNEDFVNEQEKLR